MTPNFYISSKEGSILDVCTYFLVVIVENTLVTYCTGKPTLCKLLLLRTMAWLDRLLNAAVNKELCVEEKTR